jgi:hypothetical protein
LSVNRRTVSVPIHNFKESAPMETKSRTIYLLAALALASGGGAPPQMQPLK